MSEPTMQVNLADMPEGWVCFAIGEGKPCMAPPKVADEISRTIVRAGYLSKKVDYFKEQKEILEDQRDALEEEVGARDAQIYGLEQRVLELEQAIRGDDPSTFSVVSEG